jgi:drug/metabolite transporter (DMT)-like permease
MKYATILIAVLAVLLVVTFSAAQESSNEDGVQERARQIADGAQDKVEAIAGEIDESETAQEASTSILNPIYQLAEMFSFPAFHWIAFALMVTGVVSFALQLVLAKLIVLSKLGLSLTEILSDALGLAISVVGLVLTTQAATENSSFTASPFAVLSATAAGVVVGFIFYLWGQSQEVQAAKGRSAAATKKKS